MSYDDEASTPLHPGARRFRFLTPRPRICVNHVLFVIATGYKTKEGQRYDRHYCWCGVCFRTVPT